MRGGTITLGHLVTVADVNGDGIPDLVGYGGGVQVYFGNGDGTFRPGPLSDNPNCSCLGYAVGDFNGDGKLDTLVAGWDVQAATEVFGVMFGNGDGTFTPGPLTPFPGALWAVVGDFSSDKKLDVVFTQSGDSAYPAGALLFYPGNGDGTFGTPIYSTSITPFQSTENVPVAADFNHDGNLDVALPNGSGVVVMLGNGAGGFQQSAFVSTPGPLTIVGLAAGDLNLDGNADLVAMGTEGSAEVAFVALGNGDGTFQSATSVALAGGTVTITDVNGDGKPDLVSGYAGIALGNGDGTFQKPVYWVSDGGSSPPAVVSVRSNGLLDIVSGASVLLNKGKGAYVDTPGYRLGSPVCLAVADFNGDGHPDVAYSDDSGNLRVMFGTGSVGSPLRQGPITALPGPSCITAGDFNNDGIPDVAITYGSPVGGTVGIYLGKGDGTFVAQPTVSVAGASFLCAGDFNGDGNLDLVSAYGYVMFGNGKGRLGAPRVLLSGASSLSCATGDLNGDGRADIVLYTTAHKMFVLLGNSNGTFQRQRYAHIAGGAIAIADFNGDGVPDVAAGGSGNLSIFLGNGDGTLRPGPSFPSDPAIDSMAQLVPGDFNRDGKTDLAVLNQETIASLSYVAILNGNGDGTFEDVELLGSFPPLQYLVAMDLHGQTGTGGQDLVTAGGAYLGYLINTTK